MKRILSIILAAALVVSLVPATFALEADGSQIIRFTDASIEYVRNSNLATTIEFNTDEGVLSLTNIQYRRYLSQTNNGYTPLIGIPFAVEKSGDYTVQFSTNNSTDISSVPAVYFADGTTATKAKETDTFRIGQVDKFSNRELLGYFDFSNKINDVFAPITLDGSDDGEVVTIHLEKGKTYYFLITPNRKSKILNPLVRYGKKETSPKCNMLSDYIPLLNCIAKDANGDFLYKEDGVTPAAVYAKAPLNTTTGEFASVGTLYSDNEGTVIPNATLYAYDTEKKTIGNRVETYADAQFNTAYYQEYYLSGIKLVPVVNDDPDYVKDFDAKIEENYTTSGKGVVDIYTFAGEKLLHSANNEVMLGETFNVTAPEIEGYKFLYWAKGTSDSKLVVSYENELTFKPSEGRNSLIAVYAEESAEVNRAEFYNANGTLIKTLTADGKAPEYPSMAGYGNADGWQLYGSETIYGAGEDIAVSGNMIFVAKYPETPVTVIVNGTEYTYGETVTMPELDSSKIFKGWKRNDEIVSTDPNYTFKAYENATVEAVYADKEPVFSGSFMKIVIDSFSAGDETAVMAEFIGIENAVEKGIIIGDTKKIAMKGNGNQFSILADVSNATYVGYAILKDGASFTQVIDGVFSK